MKKFSKNTLFFNRYFKNFNYKFIQIFSFFLRYGSKKYSFFNIKQLFLKYYLVIQLFNDVDLKNQAFFSSNFSLNLFYKRFVNRMSKFLNVNSLNYIRVS